MQIAILGRQAAISIAELEALYGTDSVSIIEDHAALVKSDSPLDQARLGGAMKSATVLKRLENTELIGAFEYLQTFLPEHFMYLPKGKLQFGVSVYGFKAQRDWLLKRMLTLKKVIKKTGQSVRIIENKSEILESAQVLYNKLTSELGCELLLIADGNDIIVAQTTGVQNIDDYSQRDFGRPMRDAFVGMLPPKLAQIMINLAGPTEDATIFDPFCGTGVVLQEALLMGYQAYGTDLAEKMIDYSEGNLKWLETEYTASVRRSEPAHETESPSLTQDGEPKWYVEQADATSHRWDFSKTKHQTSNIHVACEVYLGTPLSSLPDHKKLVQIMNEANDITEKFLKNLAPQIETGTRLCLALPAWHAPGSPSLRPGDSFLHLKMLDHLADLGYNRLEFAHVKKSELIYHRTDQIVARELTILEKN